MQPITYFDASWLMTIYSSYHEKIRRYSWTFKLGICTSSQQIDTLQEFSAACTGVVAGASWCFSILCHSFTAQAWLQSRILMDNLGTGDGILSHHWTKSQDSCTTPTTSYSRRHASFGRFLPFTYGNVVHFLRFERLQTFALLTKEINE
jgi:hypothetical protein